MFSFDCTAVFVVKTFVIKIGGKPTVSDTLAHDGVGRGQRYEGLSDEQKAPIAPSLSHVVGFQKLMFLPLGIPPLRLKNLHELR